VNGFVDLHVTFGDSGPPHSLRLGNEWVALTDLPEVPWTGFATSPGGPPVCSAVAPGWDVWASGSVFSYRGDPDRPLERFATDLASGTEDVAALDAHAVLFGRHHDSGEISVWTDRLGTVHAYVGGHPGRRAVGTFLPAVAEQSGRQLDWVGITGFCGFGFYPGDRTMFCDVQVLRPATRTTFDASGAILSATRYWTWWYDPEYSRSEDDLLDEFHDVWARTAHRQLAGTRSVIPLSGGLDSRTLFAVAAPSDERPSDPVRTLTYGYSIRSPEIRIARRVAASRGHDALDLVIEPYLLDHIDEVFAALEGFSGLSLSRQAGVSREIAELGDHVVGGHWGDVWFDTAGAPPDTTNDDLVDLSYKKFTKRGREWLLEHICRPNLRGDDPDQLLRELLHAEVEQLPDLGDGDFRLKVLKTEQWSFRWTLASVRAYQLALPTLLPFYANEVVEYFLRVPSDRLRGRRLQIAYLRRHHPDLARITWQDSGMSLFERPWEPTAALLRRARAKLTRAVLRRRLIERNWEVQFLGWDESGVPTPRLDDLQSLSLGSAVPAAEWRSLVSSLANEPTPGRGYAVEAAMTLGLASLREHLDRPGVEYEDSR